jgi:hypothetical protein
VQGIVDVRGWGFIGLLGETLIMGFFTNGLVSNTMLRIWLTSSLENTALAGSRWRVGHFFCSNGCISSSSSESDCAGVYGLCGSRPELGPTSSSFSILFNISTSRI